MITSVALTALAKIVGNAHMVRMCIDHKLMVPDCLYP